MSVILTQPVPTKGINRSQEPTAFSDSFSPYMKNVYVDPTRCKKRRGTSKIGSSTLPLRGTGMKLIVYIDARGVRHEIALTTTNAYLYDSNNDEWDDISPSEVLSSADSGWTAGADVTLSHDTTIKKEGTASVKLLLDSNVGAGGKLAYVDFSSMDITDRNAVGFWIRSNIAVASGDIEIVVSKDANGAKTNHVTVSTDRALDADVWQFFTISVSLSSMDAAISIGVYNVVDMSAGTVIYVDAVKAHTLFGGDASDLWSSTTATDTTEFSNNGGTALIIANGVDDILYYEGQTGDKFQTLLHGSAISSCRIVAEFWNRLMFINYDDGNRNVRSLLHAAAGDVDDFTGDTAGAYTLTDTIGEILCVRKLGSALVIYSDGSITMGRYYGGATVFSFPTMVFDVGIIAENAIWGFGDVHFFLGTDQRIYSFYGETHLLPVGEAVEDALFAEMSVENKIHVVNGFDPGRYKVHFVIPTSKTYSTSSYCFNYRQSYLSWEYHEFAQTIKSFGGLQASFTWYTDEDPLQDLYCDEVDVYTDDSYGQTGYDMASFISDDGYVYKLDNVSLTDDGDAIEFELQTPDFVINAEEQFGRWSWFSFQARAGVANSTVRVLYSTDDADTWTEAVDSPVDLNGSWTTHRLPIDVASRKIRFKLLQLSNKDVQVRGMFKCTVEPQPAR